MSNPENELETILKKYELTAVIYADTDGQHMKTVGNIDSLPHTGLARTLFGGEQEVKNLYLSTREQKLPFSWGQGSVVCWVEVTSNDKIFGVFRIVKTENIAEDYFQSKNYCAEVKSSLEKLD